MLSVIRELAEEAEAQAPSQPALAELLVQLVRRGEEAVARTPEQLQVLKDAGVVDAGGAGLLELMRGVAAVVTGQPIPEAQPVRGAPLLRRDPPGAVALHVLHRLSHRGQGARPRGARGRARAARRLAPRRRRRDRDQGARAHRRPRRGALDRHALRDDRPDRDREHARADARARGASARGRPRCAARAVRRRRGRRGRRKPPALREPRRGRRPARRSSRAARR